MGQQLMEKPWLKQYGPGVPATIDPDSHPSLVSLLESAFSTHARKDMMAYLGSRWTFAEVDALSRHLAAWLQALKLAKGARVAVMMPNIPHYAVAIAASCGPAMPWSTSTRCTPRASWSTSSTTPRSMS